MIGDAQRFLAALGGRLTFQTLDEGGEKGNRSLRRTLHGTLAEHANTLAKLNARGAGVFVMVNEGDGTGRDAASVQRVRAYYADFDTAQPPDVATVPLKPHSIIESSPGRWHWYWWIDSAPLETFKAVQVAIAERLGSDRHVCDLPRIMRLPGFNHRKRAPFRTRIETLRDAPRFTHAEFVHAFGIDLAAPQSHGKRTARVSIARLPVRRRTLPDVILEHDRNTTLLSLAAGLVHKGHDLPAVTDRLQKINAQRCLPPLCASEVDTIAMRAIGYGSNGYRFLPDALFDDLARMGLPLPVRWIVLTALRRFDGFNNSNIALTWQDCKDIPGCKDERRFLAYRAQAVTSGFLIVAHEPRLTRDGRTPTLFAIPLQYTPSLTGQNTQLAHTGQNTQSYIDKQSLDAFAVAGVPHSILRDIGDDEKKDAA